MSEPAVTLDVREDLRLGREPFSEIMGTVARLRPEEQFLLIASFEPAPRFSVPGRQGFEHQSKRLQSGDWEVRFTRRPGAPAAFVAPAAPPCHVVKSEPADVVVVDARGLEPPQPMMKILEAVAAPPAGAMLAAHTERQPALLYPQLEQRGFACETTPQPDGSHLTHLRRR